MPARPRCRGRYQLPATHRTRGYVQPDARRVAVRDDGRGSARPRDSSGAHARGGRRSRRAVGACRRDLRRRSVSRVAHGGRRGQGVPGRSVVRGQSHVIATLKHFAAHGQPESGQNCAPANVPMRGLREVFLRPFHAAVRDAGAISVMPSYNEVDGVPSHANRWLLRDVLRREWGFDGFTISDYYAIWELGYRPDTHGHFVAHDIRESCALAVQAGVNVEAPEPNAYVHLTELVREGVLAESALDELVTPILRWKFRLGLFDDPYVDPDRAERVVGSERSSDLALQAARETITLLRNDGNLLPLDLARLKTIAVIGPNASRSLLGGYSGVPPHDVTVLDGIKARVGDAAEILYSEGCNITIGGSWTEDTVTPSDPEQDRRQIAEAVKVASRADVIVLAIGGNEQTSREAWSRWLRVELYDVPVH
ncbi:MAG TPA: glycoside hydrolase family 3 N-terminal domain-containing protein [Gemmatimonadaceae bacterium]|nr:glycoside hydrolase family 3 N-terminal domain-containing protein [Gemmatimonadaceae bacterium]